MANRCQNCPYNWADEGEQYSYCHYESLGAWDPAPCEYDEEDEE